MRSEHYIPTPLESRILDWLNHTAGEHSAREVATALDLTYDAAIQALLKLDKGRAIRRVARWTTNAPHGAKPYTYAKRNEVDESNESEDS